MGQLTTSEEYERELIERKRSERQFKGLLESAPDAMVITNGQGIILMVNAQTETIFGYQRSEMIGKAVEILIPQRFLNHHVQHRNEYVENPKTRAMGAGMALFGMRKDGTEFPVEVSLSPMKLDDNEFMVISAIRDITKQKATEDEIKKINENLEQLVRERTKKLEDALLNEKAIRLEMIQNQNRLKILTEISEVFASSPDISKTLEVAATKLLVGMADWCTVEQAEKDGSFTCMVAVHVNPEKTKDLYDLKLKFPATPGSPLNQIHQTQKSLLLPQISDDYISKIARSPEHHQLINKVGLKSAVIVPLLVRNKVFGLLTLAITGAERFYNEKDFEFAEELGRRTTIALENSRLYTELHEINSELEQRVEKRTNELEAINKELEAFSYSVSHDLRAPLRSIDGFSNKILKEHSAQFNDQAKDYFNRIMNASRKMGVLIDDLLKLARLSRVEMKIELTNLSEIALNIINELKETDPGRKIDFYVQNGMTEYADRNLIQIALQNLIGNAWKYSKNQNQTSIEFNFFEKNNQLVYFIKDNGVGFDMKYVDKLFGAFQRLHSVSEFEGTGVGLATVQRIIRRHHGNIWAESEINKGTTFYFTLNE